jgi:hypothetical protein
VNDQQDILKLEEISKYDPETSLDKINIPLQ